MRLHDYALLPGAGVEQKNDVMTGLRPVGFIVEEKNYKEVKTMGFDWEYILDCDYYDYDVQDAYDDLLDTVERILDED